ncbi:MAG: 2-polyprenyl-6-methoxyphenol hydroxylase [Pseudonocardiaceae bacterium]|nr:2-polyprenyl-6-methoxyphenol hydroxylase [Pseudonocardiaceae bacterium]
MRIACVGGGPGGLFFATLAKQADPAAQVTVFERNAPDDTFGFGVVFSDATLAAVHDADPVLRDGLREHGTRWDTIEVRLKGEVRRCGGNGMAAISRHTLLALLQSRAAQVGVDLRFGTEVGHPEGYDLVVAADGANSRLRSRFAEQFRPTTDTAAARFIWFGTRYLFDGLTFVHERSPHGAFAVHGYPISRDASTFLVETDETTWREAGLDGFDTAQPAGTSDEKSKAYLEALFADQIGGAELLVNNSRWANFRTVRTRRWRAGNVVLLGDSAHTAHFSVGSGTKMAMEDAVALAAGLAEHRGDLDAALSAYQDARQPAVAKIQDSARPSLSWWEHFGRYHDAFDPTTFAFHFLSRSISRGKLARRDPRFVDEVDARWRARHGADPLETPLDVAGRHLPGRRVETEALAGARWITAPDGEDGLAAAFERIDGAALVAVHGGTALTRALLSEQARLVRGVPSAIVEPDADDDRALTLLLSGRADLIGVAR